MRPFLKSIGLGAASLALLTTAALAQTKEFKIGVIFDETGPFAGGGSKANLIGTKLAIDYINEKGGVEGYKIVPTYADAQSKVDVAINEAERLLERGQGRHAHGRLLERAVRAAGGQGRRRQEVLVGDGVHRLGRVQGQEPQVRVPPDGAFRSVRPGLVHLRHRERQGEARQGPQGRQGRHHQRGRPLRSGRRPGSRGEMQGARHPGRAQGRLRGDLDRSLRAGHQAAPRQARRAPARRLQPRHHAVPAPGQGGGPEVLGADRPRRRLLPVRQARGDLRQGRELRHGRRSGRGPAARCQDAQARRRRDDPGDAEALDRRRAGPAWRRRTCRWASTTPTCS